MNNFLDISDKYSSLLNSSALIVSVPYENTTSYLTGSANGPKSILEASAHVELFDSEFLFKPHDFGIYTKTPLKYNSENHEVNLNAIENEIFSTFDISKFFVVLGGEHSITIPVIKALDRIDENYSVVQFDAHADLRSYFGTSNYNHACVMRRISEYRKNILQLGIRSYSENEHSYMLRSSNISTIHARDFRKDFYFEYLYAAAENLLPNIYITFDVDVFSGAELTSTGTPEPGGLSWDIVLELLNYFFKNFNVIGMDVVELIGSEKQQYSAFTTALLVRKVLGYAFYYNNKYKLLNS